MTSTPETAFLRLFKIEEHTGIPESTLRAALAAAIANALATDSKPLEDAR